MTSLLSKWTLLLLVAASGPAPAAPPPPAEAPALPAPTPRAPGLDERYFCPGLVLRLSWQPVEGAEGYRVQVAREGDFAAPLLERTTARPHLPFASPGPARYLWRVAALGRGGGVGAWSEPRQLHCEAEVPREHLQLPAANTRVRARARARLKVDFSWEPKEGAQQYVLVISPTPDLRSPGALEQRTHAPHAQLESSAAGTYWWGVYVEGEPRLPLFLEPRRLEVVRPRARTVRVPSVLSDWGR